jgi:hypothetical protein
MKSMLRISGLVWLVVAALAIGGCSSIDPNPSLAHANTGYVDFYTDEDMALSWEVKLRHSASGKMRAVYSEFDPLPGSVLRLAAPPGSHTFQIWFINRATTGPKAVEVRVEDGKVTPVQVTLVPQGEVTTATKEYRFGGSSRGYGRGTKIVTDTGAIYRIDAEPADSIAYQIKEHMSYWVVGEP